MDVIKVTMVLASQWQNNHRVVSFFEGADSAEAFLAPSLSRHQPQEIAHMLRAS